MTVMSRRTALFGAPRDLVPALAGCGPDASGFVLPTSAGMNEEYHARLRHG